MAVYPTSDTGLGTDVLHEQGDSADDSPSLAELRRLYQYAVDQVRAHESWKHCAELYGWNEKAEYHTAMADQARSDARLARERIEALGGTVLPAKKLPPSVGWHVAPLTLRSGHTDDHEHTPNGSVRTCRHPCDPRAAWLEALDWLDAAQKRKHLVDVAAMCGDPGAAEVRELAAAEVDAAVAAVLRARSDAGEMLIFLIRAAASNDQQRDDVTRAIGLLVGQSWVVSQVDQLLAAQADTVEGFEVVTRRLDAIERRLGGQR